MLPYQYRLLGVTKTSSKDEIKASYWKLCKLFHPDIAKDNGDRFKALQSAYEWLLKHHVEDRKPKTTFTPKRDLKDIKNKVYRIVKLHKEDVTPISVPSYVLDEGGTLFLMNENQEIRCVIPPNTEDKQVFKLSDGRNVYMCSLIRYEY